MTGMSYNNFMFKIQLQETESQRESARERTKVKIQKQTKVINSQCHRTSIHPGTSSWKTLRFPQEFRLHSVNCRCHPKHSNKREASSNPYLGKHDSGLAAMSDRVQRASPAGRAAPAEMRQREGEHWQPEWPGGRRCALCTAQP